MPICSFCLQSAARWRALLNLFLIAGHVRGHKMQFHSWKTGAAVGPELLTPNWLAWDPAVTACALAYADAVVICRAQPSFAPVITLPLQVDALSYLLKFAQQGSKHGSNCSIQEESLLMSASFILFPHQ